MFLGQQRRRRRLSCSLWSRRWQRRRLLNYTVITNKLGRHL